MKKYLFLFYFISFGVLSLFSDENVFRYGIFVASSKGFNENDLPGAGKLVREVAVLFEDYCLLDEAAVLEDPGKDSLDSAFELARQIITEKRDGRQVQFFFYYYGHGLTDGLLLNHQVYRKEILKEKIASIDAGLRFVFLDACSSQVLSGDTDLDFYTESEGTVFITSSTQFQKAFTDVFTPILKAGLMGDADGFIPRQIDAPFFYNEISAKLSRNEQEFVRSLYGLHEYYQYRETSEDDKRRMEKLFTSLGVDSIPENIHIRSLENRILSRVNNPEDERVILKGYDYNQTCTLKELLSTAEKARLADNLEKVGFKKDNYITLSELFSYIHTRIGEKNVNHQRPTITTSYLTFAEPVRVSYFDSKVGLRLTYPGTIFVKKVNDDSLLENIVKIVPALDDGTPVNLRLAPGRYKIFVETEEAKYSVDVELKAGEKPLLPDTLDWNTLAYYRQGEVWKDKSVLDKKMRRSKKTAWIPPFATFFSFSIPLTVLLTEIGYSGYLQNQYNNETDPDKVEVIAGQMFDHEKVRNNFYIAAGACFAIPVIPFIIWMIRIGQVRKLKNEVQAVKDLFVSNCRPDIIIGQESVAIALNIKL